MGRRRVLYASSRAAVRGERGAVHGRPRHTSAGGVRPRSTGVTSLRSVASQVASGAQRVVGSVLTRVDGLVADIDSAGSRISAVTGTHAVVGVATRGRRVVASPLAGEAIGIGIAALRRAAGGARTLETAMRPVIEDRTVIAELVGADLIAVAIHRVAANLRLRCEDTSVENTGVARAEVQVFTLRRIQALYTLIAHFVAGCGCTRACARRASRTFGVGGAWLPLLRTTDAPLAHRRRSDDAQIVLVARFGAVAELAVVAVGINLALHARGPRFVAITQAMSACSAIRIAGAGGIGRHRPHEALFGARHRRAGLA